MQVASKGAFLKENIDVLSSLRQVLDTVGHQQAFEQVLPKLKELELRLQQPLRLLIMGEFNAGKSSIVNALLQADVVKTNNIATTAVNTLIEYGDKPQLQLFFEDGSIKSYPFEDLDAVTAEIEGAGKTVRKQLLYVRLFYNSPFLKDIVLVDSPGLNSHHLSHTEQTMSMIPKVDDAIWVFLGGGAGRNTEQEFLKDMVKQGIQPFGVINRIDEVDDYIFDPEQAFANDKALLGENVRGLLPISALEAQSGYQNNNQEDLELSGFLPFVDEIQKMKQNKQGQLERQKLYGQGVYAELAQIINDITKSEAYAQSLRQLSTITNTEIEQYEQFSSEWMSKKSQAETLYKDLNRLAGTVQLKAWLNAPLILNFKAHLPKYNSWKEALAQYDRLTMEITEYERKRENFLARYQNSLGSFFTKYRHLFAKREIVSRLETEYRQLQMDYYRLTERSDVVNKHLIDVQQQLSEEEIHQIYERMCKQKVADFSTFKTEYAKYKEKSHNFRKQLETSVRHYLFLLPLHKQLRSLKTHFEVAGPSPNGMSGQTMELDMTLENLSTTYKQKVASFHLSELDQTLPSTTLQFPPLIGNLLKMPNKWPVVLRPFSFGTIGLVASAGIIYGAMQVDWPSRDELDEDDEAYSASLDEDDGLNYLSYDDQGEGIGLIEVGSESVSLYGAPNFDSEQDVYLPAHTAWEVYEIDGNWYRLQDQLWVNGDDVTYEDRIKTYVSDYYGDTLATLTVEDMTVNMYDGATTDDRLLAYLKPGIYNITHISERQWVKIDDYGWVELVTGMHLDQHYLNENKYSSVPPLRTVYGNGDQLIPVFNGPSRDDSVIGFIEADAEVNLFEIPNGDWGRIGRDIWVEIDKYFEIDWTYHQNSYDESPIGEIRVTTDVLNVRNQDSQDGSLVGVVHNGDVLEVYDYSSETGWFRVGNGEWVSNRDDLVVYTPYENETYETYDSHYTSENANRVEYLFTVETYKMTPIYNQPYLDEDHSYAQIYGGSKLKVIAVYDDNGTWYEIYDLLKPYFVRAEDVE